MPHPGGQGADAEALTVFREAAARTVNPLTSLGFSMVLTISARPAFRWPPSANGLRAVPVLDAGRVDDRDGRRAFGVHGDAPPAPSALLTRVVAAGAAALRGLR